MDVGILREKNFRLLMLGKVVSLIGSRVQNFALSLYVLGLTGSATKFASVLAVTFIPDLILGPIAGVFVDWFDRKKIIVILDFLRGILIGGYAVLFYIKGSFSMTDIYVLVIVVSLASLIFQPAIATVIPSLVEKEKLVEANSVNSVIMNIGNLAAPAVAGVIFGAYGMLMVLIVNAVSFILSGISELFIKIPPNNKKPEKITFKAFSKDFGEGINYIKKKKIIMYIIFLGLAANFLFQPIGSMGRVFIGKQILGISDYQYGLMESILVIPMLIAPFMISFVSKKMSISKIIVWDMILTAVCGALLAVVTTTWYRGMFTGNLMPYISLVAVGFLTMLITSIGNISIITLFQSEVELSLMGRVNTVMSTVLMAATPLGQMLCGYLLDHYETWRIISAGAVCIFLVIMIFRKGLYSRDQKIEVEEEINIG